MSNWRDRNERDAKPHNIDIYKQSNSQKEDKNTNFGKHIVSYFTEKFVFFLGIFLGVISVQVIVYLTVNTINVNIPPITAPSSKYVCEKDSQGNLKTFLIDSNGVQRSLIGWNSTYTAKERCSEVTARLNKYTDSGALKYIASDNSKDSIKLCAVQKIGDNCTQENTIISVDLNNYVKHNNPDSFIDSKFIDYINLDRCRIYPNIKIKDDNKGNGDVQFCFIPLREDSQ
jgi:Circadian oscillating protein COP23